MNLIFKKKSYNFKLSTKVENSKTTYLTKSGWIIKLTSNDKKIRFGEVSPLHKEDLKKCANQLNMIPEYVEVFNLSEQINIFHPCIQSAINSALAEINGKIIFKENYYFDEIDKSAIRSATSVADAGVLLGSPSMSLYNARLILLRMSPRTSCATSKLPAFLIGCKP